MDVTVVVLAKNEAANLPRCLSSLTGLSDIVVVDSGSTDQTVELAKGAGVRVLEHKLSPFIIAEQRNWVLDEVTPINHWVLFLDADEALTPALISALERELLRSPPDVTGYRLCPKFMFMGKWLRHAAQYPSWHDRLIRVGKNRYTGGVWDRFVDKNGVGHISEPYLHFALNSGVSSWLERHDRYSSHFAEEWEKRQGVAQASVRAFLFGHPQERREFLRQYAFRYPEFLPFMRVFHAAILKRGILDGVPGLIYSGMLGMYEFMTFLKILEKRRRSQGLPF